MRLLDRLANSGWVSDQRYCQVVTACNRISGRNYAIKPAQEGFYEVRDSESAIYMCRRNRRRRYKKGVACTIEDLARQYNLHLLGQLEGGVFLDCGANIGELGRWAAAKKMRYVAFEPEQLEARCCDLNNYSGEPLTHRLALWHTSTTLEFHSKPDAGDSSLIPFQAGLPKKKMRAERLDAIVRPHDLGSGMAVLKLEAEGAEPEVLDGASGILPMLNYVAVDCGPERGPEKRHTFVEVNSVLADAGFRPMAANFDRVTVLYQNTARTGR